MTRCSTIASDGRRCCRPEHDPAVKHLLVKPVLLVGDIESARKVAAAWGWEGRMAESAIRGAMKAGSIPSDTLVSTMEVMNRAAGQFMGRK